MRSMPAKALVDVRCEHCLALSTCRWDTREDIELIVLNVPSFTPKPMTIHLCFHGCLEK